MPLLDKLQIDINLSDGEQTAKDRLTLISLDLKGHLLFFHSGALWRNSSSDKDPKMKEKIGGGGTRQATAVGDKIPLYDFKFDGIHWDACEVEEGVFWCTGGNPSQVILLINTKRGEIEVLSQSTGVKRAGKGGSLAVDAKKNQKAVMNYPNGPLMTMMCPHGPQVYFYDWNELRIADLQTKMVHACKTPDMVGHFHHPSLLRPSRTMLSCLTSNGSPQNDVHVIFSPTLTWYTSLEQEKTFLADLSSGEHVVLFDAPLHPLLALSSSVLLAIEFEKDGKAAHFVKVDWSLPPDLASCSSIVKSSGSRYLLPKKRIERMPQRLPSPGTGGAWLNPFLFNSSSNQFHCSDGDRIYSFSNIFNMSDGGERTIYPPPIPSRAKDLSKLLAEETPLPYDLQLTHSASNASWKVHYNVLNHHEGLKNPEDIDRLAKIVKNSALPKDSISAFLRFLYFAPPVDLENTVASFMPLCHCIQLCNQVGIGSNHTNYLLWLLEKKVVEKLPNAALLTKILTLWLIKQDPSPESIATYSNTSPLMSLFASRCRKYASEFEIKNATKQFDFSKAGGLTPDVLCLCLSFSSFLSPGSSVPLATLELSSSPPFMSLQPLKWDKNLSVVPQTLPRDKYSFVFTIKGLEKGGVICNALYLYPQWRWFERLCKTKNCDEFTTRHVVMPDYYTPSMILSILSSCYGTHIPIESLTTIDMGIIHRRRGELQLAEGRCFIELLEFCRETLYSAVNDSNCLEKLQEFWEAGFDMDFPLFVDTLKIVIKNRSKITLEDLSKLPLPLYKLIGEYMACRIHPETAIFEEKIVVPDALHTWAEKHSERMSERKKQSSSYEKVKLSKDSSVYPHTDAEVDEHLSLERLVRVNIAGDGNCFYHSMAFALRHPRKILDQDAYNELRQSLPQHTAECRAQIIAYMRKNSQPWSEFLDYRDTQGGTLNYEQWLEKMEKNGERANHAIVAAAASLYRLDIHVVTLNGPSMQVTALTGARAAEIVLINGAGVHYDAVKDVPHECDSECDANSDHLHY